ncbi:signal recognition particle protein [bacterium]|nr:signal recognition particle protein [bacterium]
MFDTLSIGLLSVLDKFRSRGVLTAENIQEGMKSVRLAMLDADVSYKVVKQFIQKVEERAVGAIQVRGVNPGQQIVKIVSDELIAIMGDGGGGIHLQPGLTVVMMAGLQGSGKTTTSGKLARLLLEKYKCKPMLVAADIYRPAAIDQLHALAETVGVPVHSDRTRKNAVQIVKLGLRRAKDNKCDVLIVDTAGRLHIDDTLMNELADIDKTVPMDEKLLVLDAMIGQESVTVAQEFVARVGFDGAVMTKMDGDARGGAALSVREITGRPIKMVSTGEKLGDLEIFHPDRMAGRILGMGDILTLIERAEENMDTDEAEAMAGRFMNNEFTLEDFQKQIRQVKRMGPLKGVMRMLPGMDGKLLDKANVDENQMKRVEAMINSMTVVERRRPEIINGSRRKRIARGSGTNVSQVNKLLKQYRDMRRMMRQINASGGLEQFSQKVLGKH